MKKIIKTTLSGALILTAGIALAGMSATNPGLPQNWNITDTVGYGDQNLIDGNPASAMCVECHTVNPSGRIADVEAQANFAILRTDNTKWGSHFVMNTASSGGANPFGATDPTTFTGGAALRTGKYEKNNGWTGTTTSKYGATGSLATTAAGTRGEMICESCHSLTENVQNAANDNDLLLATYQDNTDDTLCLGCHGTSYAGFHTGDNLVAFDGARTKRHHVLTGDVLSIAATHYGVAGTDSLMWAPKASTRLATEWCTTKYQVLAEAALEMNIDLDTTSPTIAFRNACNVGGQGTRLESTIGGATVPGDINPVDADTVNCSNCHRPHNAMSSTGAMLFRSGAGSDFTGKTTAAFTAGSGVYGLRRSSDVGGRTFNDYLPLCAGCHLGYN